MKKDHVVMKYPSAANLFRFCRRVLDHKYGGVRVIDQDVGQILGFDPADCSQWKKGKKNIRSIQAIRNIAQHLGLDEKLVVDIAAGEVDEVEAYFEYTGYGACSFDSKFFEEAKKDYYRKNSSSWSKHKEKDFQEYFDPDSPVIDEAVKAIHERIKFCEAPLYLPEIVSAYPDLRLIPDESLSWDDPGKVVRTEKDQGKVAIYYTKGAEIRPYVRYRIAKAMCEYFIPSRELEIENADKYAEVAFDVISNVFASKLLIPSELLRKEMSSINLAKDVVTQLAETFWVSKTFMNRRLRQILSQE